MSMLCTVFAPTTRDQIERLAYHRLWGKITNRQAATILMLLEQDGKVISTDPGWHFADLVLAVQARDGGDKAAQADVDATLDELVGRPL